jgi:aerobic-type carbon monoxide dehydrogenase small subunit (CoxS/CutS family)
MIMNAWALLQHEKRPSRETIVAEMEGNLCRCGAHPRIIAAIEDAARRMGGGA